ncbi:MAG: tetratricopeptide repeat protein [Planctomycetes bacterium]|nr:tetratricopeptide repeat protein [Planctomycetota bacterium]
MHDRHDEAVRNALLRQFHADLQAGGLRIETEYAARFPGHEALVAAELAALREEDSGPGDERGDLGAPPATPVLTIGPYSVRRELGRGGQATVYLAHDQRLQRDVALKVLPRGSAGPAQELRLRREAAAAARLDDSGICPVYEVGEDGAHFWLAMKYVAGRTLAALLATAEARVRDGAALDASLPTLDVTLAWFEQLSASLGRAHAAGVLHRDLKPANIMIGADGQPVLLDFGLAITTDVDEAPLTRSGDLFGTPSYLSPERLRLSGHRGDVRDDLWALAASLYECLVLQRPFRAPTVEQLYRAILDQEPAPVRRLRPSLPKDLDAVLAAALAKDPRRRYASAADFAAELRAVRLGEPIRARPPGPLRRFAGWHRRHRALATFAWTLLLGLGAVVVMQQLNLREVRAARAETDDLNAFLVDKLLLAATPDEARGRETTAAAVFDAAMQNVAASFPVPTRTAGTLYHVLGLANARLVRPQAALANLERAVTIRTEVLGGEHPDTLASRRERVGQLRQTDQLDRAEAELEALRPLLVRALGEHHREVSGLGLDHVRIALARRRGEAAAALAEANHEQLRRTLGDDDRLTIESVQLRARALQGQGNYAAAEPLIRDVLERRHRLLGADSPQYLAALSDYAQVLHDLAASDGHRNRLPDAAAAYELAMAVCEGVHGRNSSPYATVINGYASLLQFRARNERVAELGQRALALYRESLAVREALDGPESVRVANALGNLGGMLTQLEQHTEATSTLWRSLQLRERLQGPRHAESVRALFNLMMAMNHAGVLPEAAGARAQLLERLQDNADVDAKSRLQYRVGMLSLTLRQHAWQTAIQEGEPLHADCLAMWPPDGGPSGRRTADLLRLVYQRLGQPEQAELWRQRSGMKKQ